MRLAILSDIHGNYEAFKEVLADMDAQKTDDTLCLGDCIGYGPEPEAVLNEVQRRRIETVMGNHEMAACSREHLNWFNPMAKRSLEITLTMLSQTSLAFIRSLPYSREKHQQRFVHGFPPDSAQTYLFQKSRFKLRQAFSEMKEVNCFIGHTHDLELISFDGRQAERHPLSQGVTQLDPKLRYMVNVGSVGQPRDGTNHAKYVIWDDQSNTLDVRFISYDIAATVAKIKAANMPEGHAKRLL